MLWLWLIVGAFAVVAARLWVEDWKETHGVKPGIWGRAPRTAMAIGRHRA